MALACCHTVITLGVLQIRCILERRVPERLQWWRCQRVGPGRASSVGTATRCRRPPGRDILFL
eukprot:11575183-Alexandrium_andersonii.AAC.1